MGDEPLFVVLFVCLFGFLFHVSQDAKWRVVSVDRARDTKSDEIVALKKVRMDKEKDGKSFLAVSFIVSNYLNLFCCLIL